MLICCYFRPTMKTWHFGVTSLNLKPLGECLTNKHFDNFFPRNCSKAYTFLTFVLYINKFLQ